MIIGQEINAGKFSWVGEFGFAELSDLKGCNLFGRLYDDAADVGFVLVNPQTGSKIPFYLDDTENVDGDQVFYFKSVKKYNNIEFTLKIYND